MSMPVNFSGMSMDQIPQEYHAAAELLAKELVGYDTDVNGVGIGASGVMIYLLRDSKLIRQQVSKRVLEMAPGIEFEITFMGEITVGGGMVPMPEEDEEEGSEDTFLGDTQARWNSLL